MTSERADPADQIFNGQGPRAMKVSLPAPELHLVPLFAVEFGLLGDGVVHIGARRGLHVRQLPQEYIEINAANMSIVNIIVSMNVAASGIENAALGVCAT